MNHNVYDESFTVAMREVVNYTLFDNDRDQFRL